MAVKRKRTLDRKAFIKAIGIMLVIALVLSFGIYQFRILNVDTLKTQRTYLQSVYKTVSTDIFVIRDEKYITNDAKGILMSLVENGMRVARDDTVAVVLKSEVEAAQYAKKRQLAQEIAYYEGLSAKSIIQSIDIQGIDKQIYKSVEEYINFINSNNFSAIRDVSNAVRDNITHRQSVTGTTFNFDDILTRLRSEYNAIDTASMGTDVKATTAGYYISDIDGYENTAVYENVASMDIADIEALLEAEPQSVPSNVTGKLVDNFDWYIVCVLEAKNTAELSLGSQVTISVPLSSAGDIDATVYKIGDVQDGRMAVIFRVNDMNAGLATLRKENAKIRIRSYTGYRVDNRAIRVMEVENQMTSETQTGDEALTTNEKVYEKGVFILRENIISFRKIEILYSEAEFSIVKKAVSGDYLRIYDEVIIEGENLYDGKRLS